MLATRLCRVVGRIQVREIALRQVGLCALDGIGSRFVLGVGFIPTLAAADKTQNKYNAAGRAGINPAPTVDRCNTLITNTLLTLTLCRGGVYPHPRSSVGSYFIFHPLLQSIYLNSFSQLVGLG